MEPKRNRPYYGWAIVGISFVNLAVTFGIWYSFSVFFLAILGEFGWSRAWSAGVFSVFMVVHAAVAVFIGSMVDRFGPRKVIPYGSMVAVAGLLASSTVTSLWQLYLSYGIVTAIGMCSMGFITHSIFIPNWFVKRRGFALGIAMAGIGVGMQVVVPLTQVVISRFGWRLAYCTLAAGVVLIIIPLNAVFMRKNPADMGELPDGAPAPHPHKKPRPEPWDALRLENWTFARTLRTHRFWLLFLTFFFTPMAIQGTLIHQVAHVVDRGLSPEKGAFFFGLVGIMGSVGKIFFGFVSDRMGREKAFATGACCTFSGILCLMALRPDTEWILYGYAVLFGMGYGAVAPIFPARAADLFQGPHFGKIYGFLALAGGFGGGAGTWVNGRIYDLTHSYRMGFLGALSAVVAIAVLFWFTTPARGSGQR